MEQKYILQRDTLIDLLAAAATDYVIGRVTEKELQTITRIITEQLVKHHSAPQHYYITTEEE